MGDGAYQMTFLIQIPQLIFGGAEKVLVSFSKCLVDHGHDVEILETYERGLIKEQFDPRVNFSTICGKDYSKKYYASMSDIKAEKNFTPKCVKLSKLAFSKVVGYRRFAEKLAAKRYKDKHFDVAINYLECDSPEFILKHISADKYLQWIHTDVKNMDNPHELDKFLKLYERMNHIFCVSNSARQSFTEMYPSLTEKTSTLYNFFDSETIVQKSLESFEFTSQKPVLLSVGRLTTPKQYPRFLNVLAKLRDDGYSFSWHVLGTGAEREQIEKKIDELELRDRVFLDGVTDNPYKYIRACDLFVLPSGWEGFPTVTVEAKLIGKPVLATDVSGIREQIIDGETGMIVGNNEEALYNGLQYLLNTPSILDRICDNSEIKKICNNECKYHDFINQL